uniref:Envelope fusion protein n=1 Tax=Bracon brevicornis TaxID=1563983 RepID=A0A6V7IIL5_9HYME
MKMWSLLTVLAVSVYGISIGAPVQTTNNDYYDIEYIEHNAGLFYEDQGKMQLVEKEWQLIVTIDLWSFHNKMSSDIQPVYERTWNKCNPDLGHQCEAVLKSNQYHAMLKEMSGLNQHLEAIFEQAPEAKSMSKDRRAPLLGFIGTIQRSLFGVMDYNDFEHINSEIDKLYNSQSQITHLVNNATHLIRSELDHMMVHMNRSRQNIEILRNVTTRLENNQIQQSETLTHLQKVVQYSQVGEEINHSVQILLDSTRKVIEAMDAAKHGRITSTFLTPQQLKTAADKIHHEHPELEFPIPSGITDYPAVSRVSTIQIAHTQGKILIMISLPLLNRQELQIYKLHPCPRLQKTNGGMITATIKPKKPYLIVSEDRHHYSLLEKSDLEECSKLGSNLVCPTNFAISSTGLKPICEVMLLLKTNVETLRTCNIRLSPATGTEWKRLGATNKWLFTAIEDELGEVYCKGRRITSLPIKDTGIISMAPGCHLQTPTDIISHTGILEFEEVQIHLPAINLNIPEILNLTTTSQNKNRLRSNITLLSMPEFEHSNDFDVGLDETQRKLEEIGQQKQEAYHHKLITFSSIAGIGLISILGTAYVLCSRTVAINSISAMFRCCTSNSCRSKNKNQTSARAVNIPLEQLNSEAANTPPKRHKTVTRVLSVPDSRVSPTPEDTDEPTYAIIHRASSIDSTLGSHPRPAPRIITI